MLPIWEQLPAEIRGTFYTTQPIPRRIPGMLLLTDTASRFSPKGQFVMVAGYNDLRRIRRSKAILVAHGAGQSYHGDRGPGYEPHPSYAGGRRHDNVTLFICPSATVAMQWQDAYPESDAVIVGCPKMDVFHRMSYLPTGKIAITFNWGSEVCPETASAFDFYRDSLPRLAKAYKVLGTAHPRIIRHLSTPYWKMGITVVPESEAVFTQADLLIADNSSLAWEFMSLDKPVIWLNIPSYRRDVEHGMRFWELAKSGINVERPEDLVTCVKLALQDKPELQNRRRSAISKVYAYMDGKASKRAAEAIMDLHG